VESRPSNRTAVALWIAALAAALWAPAVLGTRAAYAPAALAALALLYLLLAAAAWCAAALLRTAGLAAGLAGALLLTGLVVMQLREQTYVPPSIVAAGLLAALLAPLCRVLLVRTLPSPPSRRALAGGALAASAALLAAVAVVWACAPVVRWHLLRHNTLLGTPAHTLLDPTVLAVQEELFARHGLRDPRRIRRPAAGAAPGLGTSDRPHVVFVLLDTLRADVLAPWGGSGLMPRLDRRSRRAVVLADLLASSSWTRPSVAAFFTGLLPEEHGARDTDEALPASCETLAERYQAAGYATAAIVSNVAALGADAGFAQGFEVYAELPGRPFARAAQVNRHLLAWLARRPRDRPTFLYLHYLDPHEPYRGGMPRWKSERAYRRGYDRELAELDRRLDEALAALERELGPDTLVVVLSDHGEEFFEHEHFGHGHSLYRELLHVPALVWTVGERPQTAPGRIEARLDGRDVFHLLAAVAAGDLPDLRRWAAGRERRRRYASVYYSTEGRLLLRPYLARIAMRAVEEDGLELVWSGYGGTYELYDLRRDPGETRNLAAERPADVARLARALDQEVAFWTAAQGYSASAESERQMKALGYAD
jgi:arylsulfatase A-like enzyme